MEGGEQLRAEQEKTHYYGTYRREHHDPGGDVFGYFRQRVVLRGNKVNERLDHCVHHLRTDHHSNHNHEYSPLYGRNTEEQSKQSTEEGNTQMDSEVALRAKAVAYACEGIP